MEPCITVTESCGVFVRFSCAASQCDKMWEEIINECSSEEDYLFTRGLEPSLIPIQPYQITKRWKRLVKDKYNVTADFYALKHLFLDELDKATSESSILSKEWPAMKLM
jgi:hypothetical protein